MDNLKEKKNQIVFYKSLLFKAGIIVFAALVLSVAVAGQHTYYLVLKEEEKAALQKAEDVSIVLTSGVRADFLEHLFGYWESNYVRMDYLSPEEETDQEAVEEWADKHQEVWEKYLQEGEFITPDDFDKMSDEDQLHMAEVLYSFFNDSAKLWASGEQGKDDIKYFVFKYIGNDKAFGWFGEPMDEGREAILGEVLPFTLSKHPVASRILETGKKPEKTEHIVSTLDGKEYLYAAWPLEINGKMEGLIGIQYPWAETRNNLISRIFQVSGRILLYMTIADVLLLILLYLTMLRPVKRVQQRIRDYSTEKDSSNVEQGLNRINKKQDEIGSLSRDITDLTKEIDRYVDEICTLVEEKAAVRAELSVATSIQMGLLPDKFPDSTEYDLFASMDPAKEVGGDLYDFFMVDDTHLALVIADVSGKGISAALFMVVAKTLIRNLTENGAQDPAQIFTLVNRKLMEVNRASMFVTAWLGILDLKSGRVAYVDAGHEYPAVRKAGGKFVLFPDKHCVPLAAIKKAVFKSDEFMLEPGDTLFVYTDGVPEANNEAGELMGTDRMLEILNRMPDASPRDVIENVKAGMAEYVKTAEQFDDTTMLCIRLNGCDSSELTDRTFS